ncbi:hypothetical protein [Streptomyces sampsonii]|uniref:hypothetical protein n=1 Tax=Streptomyces sampsonii TaxID=42239 RepID=UPI0013312995|nr:hypothetical protein [Streptomyces sampsonii]
MAGSRAGVAEARVRQIADQLVADRVRAARCAAVHAHDADQVLQVLPQYVQDG